MENGMLDKIRRSKSANRDRTDMRIQKTKGRLENAFFKLIMEKTLSEISVKELCKEAGITSITFYSHYADKFALSEDIFNEIAEYARDIFDRLESENNPERELTMSYCNLLDCILDVLNEVNSKMHIKIKEIDPYIFFSFAHRIKEKISSMLNEEKLESQYSAKLISSFMFYGIWGYVMEAQDEGISPEKIREDSRNLIRKIIMEHVFSRA